MKGTVIVITKGSRGIGLETTKGFLSQGATVIMRCREYAQSKQAINSIDNHNDKSRCFFSHLN
jgi:NAD(P)-dependent dehydrogenase (short-subunit alcohol dehydrogenase family)